MDHWINILVNSIVVLPFMVSAVHQINIEIEIEIEIERNREK